MWAGNQRGDFNPLPRKEGDEMGSKTKFSASISIRSLVKRETTGYRWLGDETKDFNPLPRKEGDMELKQMYQMHGNFNPLPRKEGDYNIDDVNETYSISIRSLVKRETVTYGSQWQFFFCLSTLIFNGETVTYGSQWQGKLFQSAPS